MAGPYKVLKKIGNSYKVELLDLIKVHLVFLPDKLQKAANNPLPGQKNNPPYQFKSMATINRKLKKYWPVS